jgi:hypothetical protein
MSFLVRTSGSVRNIRTSGSPQPGLSHQKKSFRRLRNVSLVASLSLATYTLGSVYPFPVNFALPPPAPPPPDPTTPASIAYVNSLEEKLQSLPLLQSLRAAPDADEWYETRPYANFLRNAE